MSTDIVPRYDAVITPDEANKYLDTLDKHPGLWMFVITQVLARPTPSVFIRKREGPSKSTLTYVEGSYAVATLAALSRLGVMSSFEVTQTDVSTEAVECLGRLTLKFYSRNVWAECSKMQWGNCIRRSGVPLGSTKKGAATDSMKKCLSAFGWALDVYTTEAEWNPPPAPDEMRDNQLNSYYERAKSKGMTQEEAIQFCVDATGKKPEEASTRDLAALKRKLIVKEVSSV